MKFTIIDPEHPGGLVTALWIDGVTGEPIAIDPDGQDRMGLVDRNYLRRVFKANGLWDQVPVYTDDYANDCPAI